MLSKNYINEENYIDETSHKCRKTIKKYRHYKKTGNKCYCLDMLEQFGPINIINLPNCSLYVSKMELVQFNDHFDGLLEKGKIFKEEQLQDDNMRSIPDKTFWHQRYYYYSKYDEGILMDEESWWSVTPEIIAEYTAKLAKNCSVIDGFCGSGGNVIQFSKYCSKVYAIDIDPKKIEICKNNCKIYNCKNNIYFIEHDFLKIEEYEPIKVRADYIFLSPPWGGISYKNSDIYSIKESMKPDISEIIKVSLRIVKYIQFYVPRTLQLEELFGIISEIKGANRLFFDIHILKSANKIKALLIIFGYDIDKKICEKEIDEYIKYIYENFNLNEINVKLISSIAKIIGNYRFLENEINFRKSLKEDFGNEIHDENFNVLKKLFNYFFRVVLNDQEKIKLKSLKIYSQYKSLNNNKSKLNKKNNNKINTIDKNKDKDQKENSDSNKNSISNSESSCNFIEKYTVTYTGDNNETYLNMKEYDKNEGEKIIIQKNPKIKKKICLKELFSNDKKMILSNVSTPTVSTSPSPIITSNNNNSILSVSTKNGKNQGEWILTPCNEIKLSFIKK